MISQLRGRVVSTRPVCVVDVGGVGFQVNLPERDVESLSPDDQAKQFFTYLHVREDRLELYGFLRAVDRTLFTRLIDVSGIGPKLALTVLSLHPGERVAAAIKGSDTKFLTSLPGLGKKTAERLAMELADKLDDLAGDGANPAPAVAAGPQEEVVLALTALGLTKQNAEDIIGKLPWPADGQVSVEEMVREALRYAGRG